jgi:hypothetical protein
MAKRNERAEAGGYGVGILILVGVALAIDESVNEWWGVAGLAAAAAGGAVTFWYLYRKLPLPSPSPYAEAKSKPTLDPLARAATVLGELRTLVPLIEAELTAQERAVAKLEAQARQHADDARKNEARAKLYEQAAQTVRDLVAETYAEETAALREQLRVMERKNRRDQVLFALGGALIGALTQILL